MKITVQMKYKPTKPLQSNEPRAEFLKFFSTKPLKP